MKPTSKAKPRKRAKVVEEFANYIGDGEILSEARKKRLSPDDREPVAVNVDHAILGVLEHDWRVKEAVEKTGRTFQEILKNCQLVLDGQPDYPSTWPIRWPCGYIASENGHLIRAVLLLVWAFSKHDPLDEETNRRHDRVVDWMAHYVAGRQLTAEHRRRQAGGRAAANSEDRLAHREDVRHEWLSLLHKPERDRAAIIAERLGITSGQVRRLVRKAGLRPASGVKAQQ